jgi:hypothetical protein
LAPLARGHFSSLPGINGGSELWHFPKKAAAGFPLVSLNR